MSDLVNKTKLVIAAWEPEIAELREWVSSQRISSQTCELKTVGIGAIEAASQLTSFLERKSYCEVIFVGTAGELGANSLDVRAVRVGLSLWTDLSAILGGGYFPTVPRSEHYLRVLFDEKDSLHTVVTLPSITRSRPISSRLFKVISKKEQCATLLENMEAYGVATVCQKKKIPLKMVLGISNIVGPEGHEQWKMFASKATSVAHEVVKKEIV